MYCLRYFLAVLLLLPFPTAPPFFVMLWVIAMTLHHRPCLYCAILIVGIFAASCSWPLSGQELIDESVQSSSSSTASQIATRCWCSINQAKGFMSPLNLPNVGNATINSLNDNNNSSSLLLSSSSFLSSSLSSLHGKVQSILPEQIELSLFGTNAKLWLRARPPPTSHLI